MKNRQTAPLSDIQRQILSTMLYTRETSRKKLAEVCGASIPTISRTVKQLIDDGYLVEKETGTSSSGRKPVMLGMNGNYGYVIAVNFVCTTVEYAVFDFAGACVYGNNVTIRRRNYFDCLYRAIDDAIEVIRERYHHDPLCISIAGHGFIDERNGIIDRSISFGWKDVHLKDIVAEKYGTQTHVISNMHLAAYGEWIVGGYRDKGVSNLAVLGIGNGLGCGAIINQTLIRGNGTAGEIGLTWVTLDEDRQKMYFLEELGGGQRLIELVQKDWMDEDNAFLRSLTKDNPHDLTDEDIIRAIQAGDAFANRQFRRIIPYVGIAVAQIARMYNPAVIVIYDIYSRLERILLDPLKAWLSANSKYQDFDQLEIEVSHLNQSSCIYGAAYAAYARMFETENLMPV